MHWVSTETNLRRQLDAWRCSGDTIALVPTMGNLHPGHLSLVETAKARANRVVVSIFVNPLQFGPNEDYARYPRTLEADREKLANCGVDLLFSPPVEEIYPQGSKKTTYIEVPGLSDILCGASRPGHFRGVATVVAKLFNLVQPHLAVFGEKDFQQLLVIRKMVADLNFPVEIIGAPIVREADGLAMSSRNQYLSSQERKVAPSLYQVLCETRSAIKAGEQDYYRLAKAQTAKLRQLGFDPDYFSILRAHDLGEPSPGDSPLVILTAAKLGQTRLIDNLVVS
ncbi:MAG: pantoate--beta-alanine ligase [Methylothermaceae bacteria B42]|nr:MAG: pantoate--beta-alanine ligase [Methylothermaceae bacteria B42]HHJ38271.1 pantoate--beta-alanine ligase [Methylothermaceae bacterium]